MATVARSRIDFENNPAATKPGNLANSAVLKMLEEEEEEQRRAGNNPDCGRRSRSRYREIDRDTVLRINRRRPRREFSWPPKTRSQSVGDAVVGGTAAGSAANGAMRGNHRDLSLDSKLSRVGESAAGATIAEDLNALQQRGVLAQQQRRKGVSCLPPLKPRRLADNKSQPYRDFGHTNSDLDGGPKDQTGCHRNNQQINSQAKASDTGVSDLLGTIKSVPHQSDSQPSNGLHSSADTNVVFTVIETPLYCLLCAARECQCSAPKRLDLSEMEAFAEASERIVAEGVEELAREKEAEELDAAIRELIDFASVVRKRPEIMNPAYIPIVEGCLQELALLAMLHSQGRIGLRPKSPQCATIEELPAPLAGHPSQSAAPDTGVCRNLPKLSDGLVGGNHNKREGRESAATEPFIGCERFLPTEGLRRVAWPPPSDVSVHPSQVPLQVNNQQPQQQYQASASAPAPTATPYQNQYQTQSYQTTTSYQKTTTESQQQQQQYYQPQGVRQPSPGIITLRTELPVSQTPAPVYASQPPVFSFKGGANMRGDQKWPPQEYKEQAAEENAARLRLAAGPACRPRRINKDYTAFFAKNALSHNYPGYRVPPGTQHVNGQSMM